jgi:hypothetical protein
MINGPWASLFSLPHLLESTGAPLVALIGGKQRSIADVLQIDVEVTARDPHLALPVAVLALAALGIGAFLLLRARVERLGRAGGQGNDS